MATTIKEEYLEVPPGFTPKSHPRPENIRSDGGESRGFDPNSVHREISTACNHKCLSSANYTSTKHRIGKSEVFSGCVKQQFPVPRRPRPVMITHAQNRGSVSQSYKREILTRSRRKISLSEQTRHNTPSVKFTRELSSVQINNRANVMEMTCEIDPNILENTSNATNYKDFNPTIAAIKAKYGHIDKDCDLKSEWLRKLISFGICNMLKELQEKNIDELDIDSLEPYYEVVQDVEKSKMNVKWLVERLDKIKDAVKSRDEVKSLLEEKNERVKKMKEKMKELRRLKIEVEKLEGQVALEKVMIDELNEDRASKFENFRHRPLMDGLI